MNYILSLLFSWKGRISRQEYFFGILGMTILLNLLIIVSILVDFPANELYISIALYGLFLYCALALAAKRFHDLGKTGSHVLFFLIPLYNAFISLRLVFERGQKEENKYGPAIPVSKKPLGLFILLALVMLFMFGASIFSFAILGLTHNDAYRLATTTIHDDPRIDEIVGEDLSLGLIPTGQISVTNNEGHANFIISVSDQQTGKEGNIYVTLIKRMGTREVVELGVRKNETIEVLIGEE